MRHPGFFTLDEPRQLVAFFREHGYAAVRGVLSEEECLETYEEVNRLMKAAQPDFDLFDPNTYDRAPINPNYGVFGHGPIFARRFLRNRQHPNVYRAFALLLEVPELLVNHDRCAFYRPTRDVWLADGVADRSGWKTEYTYPGVHLDFNPNAYRKSDLVRAVRESLDYGEAQDWITENNLYCAGDGLQLQAVLNLEDNRDSDGGFQCVPGFHRRFGEWLTGFSSEDHSPSGLYRFSTRSANDCRFVPSPVRVPVPAGALIVWDQRLAHGTVPNDSDWARLIQFLKAFPRRIVSPERDRVRRQALEKILAETNFREVTDVGRVVFGLEPRPGS
jgi:hypothetical protein